MTTTASTNQDRVYLLAKDDFILLEGPIMARVWDDVGSLYALRLQVVHFERGLLWWCGEAAFDAFLQPGHQDVVAEPLPTLL